MGGFKMGPGQDDSSDGMPDFGGEKGMKNLFDSMFTKPRREHDPNRKVGRNDLYGPNPNQASNG